MLGMSWPSGGRGQGTAPTCFLSPHPRLQKLAAHSLAQRAPAGASLLHSSNPSPGSGLPCELTQRPENITNVVVAGGWRDE